MDPFVKAQAVRKLTYLQMLGYDVSWRRLPSWSDVATGLPIKELVIWRPASASAKTTDVVLLTTNLLKKEFQSTSQYEVGLAVNCLANIVTRDLDETCQDCTLMAHSNPT